MAEGTQDYVHPASAVPAGLLLSCYAYPGFHPGLSSTVPSGLFCCGCNLDKSGWDAQDVGPGKSHAARVVPADFHRILPGLFHKRDKSIRVFTLPVREFPSQHLGLTCVILQEQPYA
jgi:hypothetical protein